MSSLRIGPRPRFLTLCRITLATVVLNVVTGAAVRLSDSGLGCPDWPTCSEHHLTPPLLLHPVIEFANRAVVTLLVVAFVELWAWVNLLSAVLAVSATLFYVFVYTLWLKRTSSQNIVIGGAAGAVPVLVGWAAVTDGLAWTPVVLFAIIFVWTPPHFWALAVKYKDDYRAASVPMLPAVATFKRTAREIFFYSVLLVAVSLVLAAVARLGPVYVVSASVLGVVFLALALRLWRQATPKAAMQLFSYSITYLTLLFVVMAADIFIKH